MASYDLGTASGRVELDTSDVDRAAAKVQGFGSKLSSSFQSAGKKMSQTGRTMTSHVTLPLLGLAAAGVKTAVDFEKTMNTMKAVAGIPGPELEKLRELAVKLGADTVFSANEAGEAMLELGKSGISTADIMGGALANTLDLATAGDLELAEAATIAANAMNVFGLSGKESTIAVDALAGAANASSADVSDLAQALAQGGLAAANAGLSIQETTAVLGAFADNGLRGSDAGTSLKTMLLSLVPTTTKAKDAMKELGISFVDAEGAIKPIPEIFEEIKSKVGPLTQAEQQLALKTIFGTDAFRAAAIAMKLGEDGLGKYTEATNKQGTAAKVATGKMKGLPGVIERLKGSFETFLLTVGDDLAPVIEDLGTQLGELLNAFSDLPKGTRETIIKFAALAVVAGPLLRIFGPMVGLVGSLAGAFIRLGTAAAGAAAGTSAIGAASGAAASAGLFSRLAFAMKAVAGGAATMGEGFAHVFPLLSRFAGPIALGTIAVHDLYGAFKGFQEDGVVGYVAEATSGWAADLAKNVNPTAGALVEGISGIFEAFRGLPPAVVPATEALKRVGLASIDSTTGMTQFRRITQGINLESEKFSGKLAGLVNGFNNLVGPISQTTQKMVNNLLAAGDLQGAYQLLKRKYDEASGSLLKHVDANNENRAATQKAIIAAKQHAGAAAAEARSQENATGKARNHTGALKDEAGASDQARREAEGHKGALDRIPPRVNTDINTNAEQAKAEVDVFRTALGLIETVVDVFINVIGDAIPGNARGTRDWVGGLSLVGERGPELAVLPKHTAIIPAHITRGIMNSRHDAPNTTGLVSRAGQQGGGGGDGALVPARVTIDMDGVQVTKTVEQHRREQRITLGRR